MSPQFAVESLVRTILIALLSAVETGRIRPDGWLVWDIFNLNFDEVLEIFLAAIQTSVVTLLLSGMSTGFANLE